MSGSSCAEPAGLPMEAAMDEEGLRVYRRKLPHWRIDGSTYFVTWRVDRDQSDLTASERTCVAKTIRHFDLVRYELLVWVVMNDHVHVVLTPFAKHPLESIVR